MPELNSNPVYEATTWGAGLTALYAPPQDGGDPSTTVTGTEPGGHNNNNILLSFPTPSMYRTHPHPYFHSTIGRVANRIADAVIRDLNGRDYPLAANNGPNCNHGGAVGWDKQDWTDGGSVRQKFERGVGDDSIVWEGTDEGTGGGSGGTRSARLFKLTSRDGDEGFPGTVEARVWYAAGRGSGGKEHVLEVEWEAELVDVNDDAKDKDKDKADLQTVVAMTNHAYFNLNPSKRSGSRTLAGHSAKLGTARYLPFLTDNPGIPEGRFENFPGLPKAPFASFPLEKEEEEGEGPDAGEKILDIDHCFVLDEEAANIPTDTRRWPLQTLAELHGDESGIHLAVESTEPAFQFYTGKWIDVPGWEAGEEGSVRWEAQDGYKPYAGLCIEPSRYANAAGRKAWRHMVQLGRGQLYGARTRYVVSRQ